MSKRSDRREADRIARKLAYQELRRQNAQSARAAAGGEPAPQDSLPTNEAATSPRPTTEQDLFASAQAFFELKPEPAEAPKPISEAQLAANRANARHSTGATTPEGKAKSSRNAIKHGLTSQTVVLPLENAADYQDLLEGHIEAYAPVTKEDHALVQTLVDSMWRLDRVNRLETAILLKGQLELAKLHEDRPPLERARLIEADAYIKYEKQLRNLFLQEARLRRLLEKQRAELTRIKAERLRQALADVQAKLKAEKEAAAQRKNGFDFANTQSQQPNQPQPDHNLKKQAA